MRQIWNIEVCVHVRSIADNGLTESPRECCDYHIIYSVHIFFAECKSWRWDGAKKKRPLSSVALEPAVKDLLIADARDFLASEERYAERGIPYRRGYLLDGVPGSEKMSLIQGAIAPSSPGIKFNRSILQLLLASSPLISTSWVWILKGQLCKSRPLRQLNPLCSISDKALTTLLEHIPARCILVLEGACAIMRILGGTDIWGPIFDFVKIWTLPSLRPSLVMRDQREHLGALALWLLPPISLTLYRCLAS